MAEGTEKIENRLKSMDSDLCARGQTAETLLWGVAHVFSPPKELLQDIRKADIVTLELPPGAITHRKKETDKNMLAFWNGVLGEIENSNKRVWAVDSNKILRNTRKAIIRRQQEASDDKRLTILLKSMEDLPAQLDGRVLPEKLPEIIKTLESDFIAFVPAKIPSEINRPNQENSEEDVQLFIAKPFPASVKDVCKHVRMRMESRLREEEFDEYTVIVFALDYIIALLMSYIDKTQAYEMLRRLQNFCKLTEKKRILHVHVGGYIHDKNLIELLNSTPHERYTVTEKKDTRFPIDGLSTFEFFGRIPLRTRIGLVHVEKNEVALDTDRAKHVFDAISKHKDMEHMITYMKIEDKNGMYLTRIGGSEHCRVFREMLISHLSSKIPPESLVEIEKRCVPAKYPSERDKNGVYNINACICTPAADPLETFLSYLKEKGFKPGPETLQYIKKGRENRCI